MFEPQYRITDKIITQLTQIAEARVVISRAKILTQQEISLRRQALIRMTQSSTAIEGNRLNIHQVRALAANKKIDAPERDIYEVQNYLAAMRFIEKSVDAKKPIDEKLFLHVHGLVTHKTLPEDQSGIYRRGPVYVVRRQIGFHDEILYTGPDAIFVPLLITDLIEWIDKSEKKYIHPVLVAGITHHEIAAIHPFNDGNGRTARAVATLVLYKQGYDFRKLFALEDYYNRDRPAYYSAINSGDKYDERREDLTRWLEYFVTGVAEEIGSVKQRIVSLSAKGIGKSVQTQVLLDKNQVTIIDFLEQMGRIATSDVVDILKCPRRTAQLHLHRLKKLKMIRSIGKGRATYYKLR